MYCPGCSIALDLDPGRYCRRCGCSLEGVKTLVETNLRSAEEPATSRFSRHTDISLGAILMYLGGVVAMFWANLQPGPDSYVLPQVFFIIGLTLAFIQFAFHPLLSRVVRRFFNVTLPTQSAAKQREGINAGAMFMFMSIWIAWIISLVVPDAARRPTWIVVMMTLMLLVTLIAGPLIATAGKLLSRSSQEPRPDELGSDAAKESLPAGQTIPAQSFLSRSSQTAEIAPPPSVTEHTTQLLNE
jgi:hypothetical protein